jgi:hypothetical protein
MDKKIRKFYIGFERLGWDLIHNINDLRSGFPFGQERELFHSTAFFLVEDNLGVIADYGGKKKMVFFLYLLQIWTKMDIIIYMDKKVEPGIKK